MVFDKLCLSKTTRHPADGLLAGRCGKVTSQRDVAFVENLKDVIKKVVIYENLAVYKSAFDLCVYFEKIVKNFDKGHKFAIGADLKNKSRQIALQVIRANNSKKSF